jgi:hypothetical protein
MDERIARLRAHRQNIDRYQGLLKTTLNAVELQFLEARLSEERLAVAMLEFFTPPQIQQEGPSDGGLSVT